VFQRFDASGEDRGERYFYNAAGYLNEVREARYAVGATVYHKVVAMDARGNVIRAALGNGTDIQRFSKVHRAIPGNAARILRKKYSWSR
jgi:hypothetical protein